jgi:fatty acid desaturase
MKVLPAFLQWFLTWMTGKPLIGQQPLVKQTQLSQLVMTLATLFGGVALSGWLMAQAHPAFWMLLPVSWLMTVHTARKFQTGILHEAAHLNFSGSRLLDAALFEVMSTILMIQDFAGYHYNHVALHHGKKLATLDDLDVQFLIKLGFRPGTSVGDYWRQLRKSLFSPRFHALYLMARLKFNFVSSLLYRRLMAMAFAAGVLVFLVVTQAWIPFLFAYVFPLTLLYHISGLFQFLSEHRWLRVKQPGESNKIYLARLTTGRFSGEPVPDTDDLSHPERVWAWTVWAMRMAFIHLPLRLFVLQNGLPQHDYHHRYPRSKEWANMAYARQRDIEAGCPFWAEPYTEVWGLMNAVDEVFFLLSSLPPLEDKQVSLRAEEVAEIVGAM